MSAPKRKIASDAFWEAWLLGSLAFFGWERSWLIALPAFFLTAVLILRTCTRWLNDGDRQKRESRRVTLDLDRLDPS